VPWTDGSIVEKELFVPSLPEANSRGILTPPGFVQASAFGIYPIGPGFAALNENVGNFLRYSKTPSTMEFRSHMTELQAQPKVSATFVRQSAFGSAPSNRSRSGKLIEHYFKLAENQTTVRRELLGGLTTFMTMAYIIVVNPQILGQAGMRRGWRGIRHLHSSAAASLVMGLYANYPIALAPGMSLNAYFTYSVCLGMHIPWQTALGVVFFSGVLFILLTVTRVREQIVNGFRLLEAFDRGRDWHVHRFCGMRSAKLVVANPATFVGIGNFSDPESRQLVSAWCSRWSW